MQNCQLSHSFLNNNYQNLWKLFPKCSDIHSTPTRSSMSEFFHMQRFRSTKYGMNSINNTCIFSWNSLTQDIDSPTKLQIGEMRERLFKHYIDNY